MPSQRKRTVEPTSNNPTKKQKRQKVHGSESDSAEADQAFDAVDLLDSDDDDIQDAKVDDAVLSGNESSSSSEDAQSESSEKQSAKSRTKSKPAAESDGSDSGGSDFDDSDLDSEEEDDNAQNKRKSKRNDPNAFATSISKILSTKLSSSKRADPVLSRSAAAHHASKAAVDSALEAKARRHIKETKKRASEKGRVKDVLVASRDDGDEASTVAVVETERRLRKVAHTGVVKLFNAVRAAQVKAAEAERSARREGVLGVANREIKVNEMSKKGFLDLIASGGGGLKKGGLEEA